MKIVVGVDRGGYAFNAAAKTLTLTGLPTFTAENLALITNQTDGIIIYNFADPAKGATVAGAVITLEYDTATMDNGDKIQIIMNIRDDMNAPCNAEYTSPTDFTATYTSAATITLAGLPITITDSSQIEYIKYIPTGGTLAKYLVNGVDGVTITHSAGVLTVTGVNSPFAAGDVYEVGITAQRKAYDPTLDVTKTMEQAPVWSRYTDPEALLAAAQNVTTSFVDVGPEVDVRGYSTAIFRFTLDINQAINFRIKILGKHTSAGAEEYEICPDCVSFGTAATFRMTDAAATLARYWEIDVDADQLFFVKINCGAEAFLQMQIAAETAGATAGQADALYVTKSYE